MTKKLFFLLAIVFSFQNCKSKTAKEMQVTGRWRPIEMNVKGMTEEEKKDMIDNLVIEFAGNGKFTLKSKGRNQDGTYTFDKNTKTLVVKNADKGAEANSQTFTLSWEGELMLMTNEEGTVKLKRQ